MPRPGNGMGAFEGSLQVIYGQIATQLYPQISPEIVKQASGQGLIVAVAYRIITVLIALVGVVIYLTSRRELDQAMHDAEEIEQPPADPDALLTQQA